MQATEGRVQLQAIAIYTAQTLGFAAISEGLAVVEVQGYARLIYSSRNGNLCASLSLGPVDAVPRPIVEANAPGADLALQQNSAGQRLFAFSAFSDGLRAAPIAANGVPGAMSLVSTSLGTLTGVTAMEIFEFGSTDIAVVAQRGNAGLRVFTLNEGGALVQVARIMDGTKAYLADISDLASVTIGTDHFLLVLSGLENGVTSFKVDANGSVQFIDSLGNRDGLAITGPAALQMVEIGGQQFAVIASTTSDSLSVVRVNPLGCLFQTDHLIDSRETRIADVAALDLFQANGRSFVVAAGSDNGLSLFELLPGGKIEHLASFALETGAGIGNVTSIEAVVLGNKVAILMVDASGSGIYHYEVPLATLGSLIIGQGGTVAGTALDDRLLGSNAAETLQGGAGDDFLHDGGGADVLFGGAGADVFVLSRDGQQDRIADFTDGADKIDLSDWGMIYSAAALSIQSTATGARISFGGEVLIIDTANGTALNATNLTDADFLF